MATSSKVKSKNSVMKVGRSALRTKDTYYKVANRKVKKILKENMEKHAGIWHELAKH